MIALDITAIAMIQRLLETRSGSGRMGMDGEIGSGVEGEEDTGLSA